LFWPGRLAGNRKGDTSHPAPVFGTITSGSRALKQRLSVQSPGTAPVALNVIIIMPIRFPSLNVSVILLALLSGCSGASPDQTTSGRLVVATADDVKSLDPALANDTWSTAIVHALTRRLVDYDREGNLFSDIADWHRISEDGRTYTFQIRDDQRFEDGSPLTAEHFKAAIERVLDPATASPGRGFFENIEEVETPDAETLVVRLRGPDPTFLNVMGMTFAAPYAPGGPEGWLASGPYRLERYEPHSEVILARNEYRNGHPERQWRDQADPLVVQLRVPESLQWLRFQNGEVHLLPAIPAAEYARVMRDEHNLVKQGVVNQTWYFGMNVSRAPWNDPRVRRAAMLAIDRKRHVQISMGGVEANGLLPPHVPGYRTDRALPEHNLEEARRLVAEVSGGRPLRSVLWLANNERYQHHAELIQSDLADAGIQVELRPVTFSEYLTGYRTQAGCWYGGWYPDFPDAGNFLIPVLHGKNIAPGTSPNAARYDNSEVNRLFDQAQLTPLGEERNRLFGRAEDRILEDLPWVPLYYEAETRCARNGVYDVRVDPVWRQVLTGLFLAPGWSPQVR
jgi:ABC-type transport system substrate-binding protein